MIKKTVHNISWWLAWLCVIPLYFFLFLSIYWINFDTKSPLVEFYTHPYFHDGTENELDKLVDVKTAFVGEEVYLFHEYCLGVDIDASDRLRFESIVIQQDELPYATYREIRGTAHVFWEDGVVFKALPKDNFGKSGCYSVSFPVKIPNLPSGTFDYNVIMEHYNNPLQEIFGGVLTSIGPVTVDVINRVDLTEIELE